MPSRCLPNRLISNFLYDIVSIVPMDVQVATDSTDVCYVELNMVFGSLRSCLMCSVNVFTVFVVAGFITQGAKRIFYGENCDGKRRRRC